VPRGIPPGTVLRSSSDSGPKARQLLGLDWNQRPSTGCHLGGTATISALAGEGWAERTIVLVIRVFPVGRLLCHELERPVQPRLTRALA
jgi:hypothetical protein